MKLQNIFQKDIKRIIDGVIKVDSTQQISTELEEYVVTKELDKLLRKFFQALKDAEWNSTENVWVWISGFFWFVKIPLSENFMILVSKWKYRWEKTIIILWR
jgi:hypothetical protein